MEQRETININQMIALSKLPFPLSEASFKNAGLAKTDNIIGLITLFVISLSINYCITVSVSLKD